MQYEKQILGELEKCYALSSVTVDGRPCLLVAAEKKNPCFLFAQDGTRLDTVWEGPGGVMTMVPVPGRENVFLATQKFYSPNDSAEAYLICCERCEKNWHITKIADLPFVHRFDLIPVDGIVYVLACTLKSGHEYKNDWRFPGKLFVGVLGDDPAARLELTELKGGLGHNHGYTRFEKNGVSSGVVACDDGVYRVTPPTRPGEEWSVETLLEGIPCSDALLIDMDGDGEEELFTISPFHGDTVCIWRRDNGAFSLAYEHPEKLPFLHAICGGSVYGRATVYAGNREGERLLLGFFWDAASKSYRYEEVDRGGGPANCMLFRKNGRPALLASNRESDEVAVYDIRE